MALDLSTARRTANHARYVPGQRKGHYESFFLRANHPSRPLALWIRYAMTSPEGRPDFARGELWAIVFNGETGEHVAVKREVPMAQALFDRGALRVIMGGAELNDRELRGESYSGGHVITWELAYEGEADPLFLQPIPLYTAPLPKAKSLVSVPFATFKGTITVDGNPISVEGWPGSQNHNWGQKHTDHYAWGQVAGFDDHPASFLEVATARLRFGPLWTPRLTPMVLRHDGEEHALNTIGQAVKAHGSFEYFTWSFRSRGDDISVEGTIEASARDFVGLSYANPPGGFKHCLNSKIAGCSLVVQRRGREERLTSRCRAAFEILTDDRSHGIPIAV